MLFTDGNEEIAWKMKTENEDGIIIIIKKKMIENEEIMLNKRGKLKHCGDRNMRITPKAA